MFGGMSLLNNLFDYSRLKEFPLVQMIACGSLMGIICIVMLYIFFIFILRITDKITDEKSDLCKRYEIGLSKGIMCLFGLLIISVLIYIFKTTNIK